MKGPNYKPTVNLTDHDGNAFAIMNRVKNGLIKAGADQEHISMVLEEMKDGDYDNLLQVAMKHVEVV